MQNFKCGALGEWAPRHVRLLLIIFAAALIAKGGVILRGFAVDDYLFGQGFSTEELRVFLTQGRFLHGGIDWFINALGVNISDLYISLGICALFLQAALVTSILRFVGAADFSLSALIGAAIVSHPYLAEILTFRMVLPGYCVATILSIVALEMTAKKSMTLGDCIVALAATVAMLFVYQGFLNLFAVAVVFAFLFDQLSKVRSAPTLSRHVVHPKRVIVLSLVCLMSAVLFLTTIAASKALGLVALTGRANFIELSSVSERATQIAALLQRIYWMSEPIVPHWIKVLIAAMILFVVALVCAEMRSEQLTRKSVIWKLVAGVCAVVLLIPITVGVILPFKDWWPVPRVLAQVPFIIGLFLLLAAPAVQRKQATILKRMLTVSISILVVCFVFISNQVFADQQRLNSWDKERANRIVSRLEQSPNFSEIKSIYLSDGAWGYPARLNTLQGDMNISAFAPEYSRVSLMLEASGYSFKKATGDLVSIGMAYCKNHRPWPHVDSVSVVGELAVVCLSN
ncbi:glucosyltransferase domain-containing protein [Variovorax saccharolyticus]|uniref:glucosyltransferase domain-containing protein n=1 Tax=Variovorax saccharolyticus TaxID=3053516 RepID=UPI002574BDFA|nr:glucosyltransferase domain-containing protein [Variovorax sp. J22R187]MDM0017553.1 glucosyltransferase domain-containing protein [Variovorax sp. J22R187]